MPRWHNRQPNPEMNPAPDKRARDNRKAFKADRAEVRRADREGDMDRGKTEGQDDD